ncbi:dicarboxylate/amino acid:cation symporter [Oleiagrimonas soli]|uniref:DAACS family dicarboxylate/amino acid:cation (Na+ or H+) symporter n=1 Tax=Oleiagrimonas soli TaxID=1543381 RepID=A0A841KNA1_9GAMM|nr:dicarboxylate/amino acid:cation symporter [Oleiagrimonas soli]MBB6185319.1 DAACS family dicarboxylate/amino acid:cation (Na+ or H+) symporter [Oleiagrimonas soli]
MSSAGNGTKASRRGLPLHTQMLIGFIVGALAGLACYAFAQDAGWLQTLIGYVTQPVGDLFLRLLFMLVVPLVFSALVLGVVEIGDPRSLGRVGLKTLLWILGVTAIAVTIGLILVNVFQPGQGVPHDVGEKLLAEAGHRASEIAARREAISAREMLLGIVPLNPVRAAADGNLLGLMFFALMFGIAAAVVRSEGTRTFVGAMQGVYDISLKLIEWVIRIAPYAVAALLFTLTARLGWDVLLQLARYVGVVLLALVLQCFVVLPLLVRYLGGMPMGRFFRGAETAMVTAFSTSSSSATLPTTLQAAERRLGVPRRISRFVCTLGATANMNGTALYEGVTVLFLAQFFGVDLSFAQQSLVLLICVLGGVGAAGVPGGSLPVIAMILGMFGIPPEGIGLVLGIDRLLDMSRTALNVTGDLAAAVVIARGEDVEPASEVAGAALEAADGD